MTHEIIIAPLGRDHWSANLGDRVLVGHAREPVYSACRRMVSLGMAGSAIVRHQGSPTIALRIRSIEAAAKLTVAESPKLATVQWEPMPPAVIAARRASAPSRSELVPA